MLGLVRNLSIGAAAVLLGACAGTPTTFTSTWKSPDVQTISPVGKTIAAVFVTKNEGQRRSAEDLLVRDLNAHGAKGVPSYSIIPSGQGLSGDDARKQLRAAGCDGAVVLRVVGKDQQVTYSPGTAYPAYYGGFGPYWGYGWGAAYSPGYLQTDTLVSVETLVYSLSADKLLWAGTSSTQNPDNLQSLIEGVANAVSQEMYNEGMLAAPPAK
jgi:hypothetical protein